MVVVGQEVRGKPKDAEEVRLWWEGYAAGQGALVVTTVVVGLLSDEQRAEVWTEAAEATVHFGTISDENLERYIASGECFKSAGAFDIDNPLLKASVTQIDGEVSAVKGMPIAATKHMLANALASTPT